MKIKSIKEFRTSFFHNALKTLKNNQVLIFFILFVCSVKILLAGQGFLSFPDEYRFLNSYKVLTAIINGEFKTATTFLFSSQGRPGFLLLSLIPASFQLILGSYYNLKFSGVELSFVVFAFNYLLHILILILHFKFSKKLLGSTYLSLLCVLLYCSLTNSFIYLRHAFPYDMALFILYVCQYQIVRKKKKSLKNYFFIGFFCCFSFFIYPGFAPLFLLISLLIFINFLSFLDKKTFLNFLFFAFGISLLLILTELLSRYSGKSLFLSLKNLSSSVKGGSYSEGFSFIFKYLLQVEKINGTFIIISLAIFVFQNRTNFSLKTYKTSEVIRLFTVLLIVLLLYSSYSYFFHGVVYFGRTLHQFFPMISILSIYALKKYFKTIKYLSFLFIISFIINYKEYYSFKYPIETLSNFEENNLKILNKCEHENVYWNFYDSKKNNLTNPYLIITNLAYFHPIKHIENFKAYTPPKNYKMIFCKKHFLGFKAYQFEGFKKEERETLDDLNLKIKVFKNY